MKILFIYPNLTRQEYISLGIAYLSSCLKRNGHQVYLIDYTFGGKGNDCIKKIKEIGPDLICFSLRSGEYNFSSKIASEIKQNFNIKILFGGVHPTVDPENTIKDESINMICLGEGEEALLELVEKMEKGEDYFSTKNFWFKKDGQVIKNPLRPLNQNLDSIPFPDRDLFDFKKYVDCRNGNVDMIIGRGCPFHCTYCINHILQKLYDGLGKFTRLRRVDNVLEEVDLLVRKYNIKSICFQDDLFTIDKNWIKEFSEKYSKEFGLPFQCLSRTEMITPDLCNDLKKAGCQMLAMGIESGNRSLRQNILKRNNTDEDIINAFKIAREAGIKTHSFNMIGLPYETQENINESIKLNRNVKPDFLRISIFQPYPGTELHRICKSEGWITGKEIPASHKSHSILSYPNITKKEIKKSKRFFRYNVLKESDKKRALISLFIDYNETLLSKLRERIPKSIIKRVLKMIYS